jgi:tripartite-type tricarboxylate transporter receptor subunit TctC
MSIEHALGIVDMMKIKLGRYVVALTSLFISGAALATYPERPVRVVIGFPAGTATDVATRILVNKMSEDLGRPFVVDNKPGAGTNIAALAVAKSAADGYTLFMAGNTNSVNPSLLKTVPFDVLRDFSPIGLAVSVPSILVVHPSLGVNSVSELTGLVKNKPGTVFFASSGNGTMSHLAGELFGMSTNSKMVHVAYKGSAQATTDLLSGGVPVMFAPASTVLPFIKAGKLKALATTGVERSKIAPDLPTVSESGVKGYDTRIWFGLVAPAGTPDAILKILFNSLDKSQDAADVKDQLFHQGIEPFKGNGKAFSDHMSKEIKKWTEVVTNAGITAD